MRAVAYKTLQHAMMPGADRLAGALACWNHPFEVARIEAQARADQGQSSLSMPRVMSMVRLALVSLSHT